MAAPNLLALIDDIAKIQMMSLLCRKLPQKTAGVLCDDLALNAEHVSGVKAKRELPIVRAVVEDYFLNKLVLVPSALLISAFLLWLIVVLLVIGGLYLRFEGVEMLAHKSLHSKGDLEQKHAQMLVALADPSVDLVVFEKSKIKGAIRADFILSA
ncbi:MAG: putative DNA repair protein MutK [Flavobacteriales bacterium]|jgi:predicted DNA repair protein MutK